MPSTSKVQICQNHLPEFYEAIKAGDLSLMDKIEHELTEEEKCVACAYVFKTRGTVREALEEFLNREGLDVTIEEPNTPVGAELLYWGIRLFVFFLISAVVIFATLIIKRLILHQDFSFNILEFVVIGFVILFAFLFVDDKFFD